MRPQKNSIVCQFCGHFYPPTQVFLIRDLWACDACGRKEIEKWNELVAGAQELVHRRDEHGRPR